MILSLQKSLWLAVNRVKPKGLQNKAPLEKERIIRHFTVRRFTTTDLTCKVLRSRFAVSSMPARKMKVDVFDTGGNRYSVTFEGQVTRDKALRLLEIVELLGGMPGGNPSENKPISEMIKQDKVRFLVERNFPLVWFSSKEVQTLYESELKEPISLSTVSTYLSRLAERGFLSKTNAANKKRYRMTTQLAQNTLALEKGNRQPDNPM